MLSNQFVQALSILSEKLMPSGIEWYVTGKGNLALQGIEVTPSRLQILIYERDLEPFLILFSGFERTELEELSNGEAKEFKMMIEGIEVLVCAEYPHGAYWVSMEPPLTIALEGLSLPCFTLPSEQEAYKNMGLFKTEQIIKKHLQAEAT